MKDSVFSNFIWRFCERWFAQGVTLVVGIILARILDPELYGTIALITVFTNLLQVFVEGGLSTALIQKKDADEYDFSTVFWYNVGICIILYVLVFLMAPCISNFYSCGDLTTIIRVLAVVIIVSGLKNIQIAYVSRKLMFRKFFLSTLGGTIGAAAVGIIMAFNGYGVWALVTQYIFNTTIDTIILWITVGWRPKWFFSIGKFRILFNYGWKILMSSILNTIYNELRSLIIGKYYSSEDLAFYSKGTTYPKYFVENINSSMNSVLLPALAQKQDNIEDVKNATRRVIRQSSYIIWPLMIGLFVVADKFVLLLLTDKWLPAVFFLRVMCFSYALQPLQTTNLSVVKALGHAGIHLKLEVIKKIIAITIVVISSFISVNMIAVGSVFYSFIATWINTYPSKKIINYGYKEQIKDVLPYVIMSGFMGAVVYFVGLIPVGITSSLIIQVLSGVVIYLACSIITKNEAFMYYLNIFSYRLKKRI